MKEYVSAKFLNKTTKAHKKRNHLNVCIALIDDGITNIKEVTQLTQQGPKVERSNAL